MFEGDEIVRAVLGGDLLLVNNQFFVFFLLQSSIDKRIEGSNASLYVEGSEYVSTLHKYYRYKHCSQNQSEMLLVKLEAVGLLSFE
jgi:hypothetical protein